MAKRKRENDEKQIEKKRKRGRGEGRLENYKPWLDIQDVPSKGIVTRANGTKTGRIHQLLSILELNYFHLLEWAEEVIDIREQFPLDLAETLALAKEISIKHPLDVTTQKNIVMTTDFLITIRQPVGAKEVARTVKHSTDLVSSRVLEKFEIERLYWKERNIDWGIVTELDLNKVLIKNIKWLYQFREQNSLPILISDKNINELTYYLLSIIKKKNTPLRQITSDCDDKFNLPAGSSLAFVRHLLAIKSWKVNMMCPIQPEKILNFIAANQKGELI